MSPSLRSTVTDNVLLVFAFWAQSKHREHSMSRLTSLGTTGRERALASPAVSESTVAALFESPIPAARLPTEGLVGKAAAHVQLACAAAIVLANLLLPGQGAVISNASVSYGVLLICGFAMLASTWVKQGAVETVRELLETIARRSIQVAALVGVSTISVLELTNASWTSLRPLHTFSSFVIIVGLGVMLLALARWLADAPTSRCIVIFGDGTSALALAEQLRRAMPHTNVCLYPPAASDVPETSVAEPCHLDAKLVELGPDVVIISLDASGKKATEIMTSHLAPCPIDVLVHSSQGGAFGLGPVVHLGGVPFIRLYPKPLRAHQRLIKRAFDIAGSVVLLAALFPFLIAVATLIKIDSPGPVLFRQPRVGQGGRHFTIFKFRTMHVAAADLPARQDTVQNDPRVTRVGKWIRKCSIDELPQLLNVLLGTMSIVGPRPHAMNGRRFADCVGNYHARHRMRPGITGLAQVLGWRGPTDTRTKIEQRVANDLYYVSHWSLRQDCVIIGRTLFAMWGKNAF
jgi:exopolysaccharide biosynthesis polyprenyl glycosylphosphotransferase